MLLTFVYFQVDREGVYLHGVCVYVGNAFLTYTFEVLTLQNDFNDKWFLIEKTAGMMSPKDFDSDTCAIKLTKSVKLDPLRTYCLRVYLQGGNTYSGEGGMNVVHGKSRIKFTFSSSSLSPNGTNVSRGQIPVILYSLNETGNNFMMSSHDSARHILSIAKSFADKLQHIDTLANLPFSATEAFIPRFFGHIIQLCHSHPIVSYEILNLFVEPFMMIADYNSEKRAEMDSTPGIFMSGANIETSHPYPSCDIQIAYFSASNAKFIVLEFDQASSTCQPSDRLIIYMKMQNLSDYTPIMVFSECSFPTKPILLPSNDMMFVFESTTRPKNTSVESVYGFSCNIKSHYVTVSDCFLWLEMELVNLCSSVCGNLIDKSHKLAFNFMTNLSRSDIKIMEDDLLQLTRNHASLLSKGMNLPHAPSFSEITNDRLKSDKNNPEIAFLYDFITASKESLAGHLAHLFMNHSYIDPYKCEITVESSDSSDQISVTIITKNQHGLTAFSENTNVNVWIKNQTENESNQSSDNKSAEHFQQLKYQPTYMNRARYISITMMKPVQDLSFEELRLNQQCNRSVKEIVHIKCQSRNGIYTARWTPKVNGTYKFEGHVDDFTVKNIVTVEIRNGKYHRSPSTNLNVSNSENCRVECSLNDSRGVRIRNEPSLTCSAEIGYIQPGSSFFYIDIHENEDGNWLRLSEESLMLFCGKEIARNWKSGWCLQFNKRLSRHLLTLNIDTNKPNDYVLQILSRSIVVECDEWYRISFEDQQTTASVHSHPSKGCKVIGIINSSDIVQAVGWIQNSDGVWIKLKSADKFLFANSASVDHQSAYCCIQKCNEQMSCLRRITPSVVSPNTSPSTASIVKPVESRARKISAFDSRQKETGNNGSTALSSSVADSIRAVFAAVLWHDGLVNDAIACAAYLKFHPDIQQNCVRSNNHVLSDDLALPTSLKLLWKLWDEIYTTMMNMLENHVILPSPPMISKGPETKAACDSFLHSCELCDCSTPSIVLHMRLNHPGCKQTSTKHCYNEQGRWYEVQEIGLCGKTVGPSLYYMCETCRQKFIKDYAKEKEIKKQRARSFRLSSVNQEVYQILKNNALFLLQLNSSDQACVLDKKLSGLLVSKERTKKTSNSRDLQHYASNSKAARKTSKVQDAETQVNCGSKTTAGPHSSDPGPKNYSSRNWIIYHSESFNRENLQAKIETESDDLLSSPSVALKTVVQQTESRQQTVAETCSRPVIAFVIQHHDLQSLHNALHLSTARAIFFEYAFQTLNTLLRSTTNPLSISDVLYHFVDGLTNLSGIERPSKLVHPLTLTLFSGHFKIDVIRKFHNFLQSVSSILRSFSNVSLLTLQNCCKAWMFEFLTKDQDLIIQSNIVSILNNIVSERNDTVWDSSLSAFALTSECRQYMVDITEKFDVLASSHQQMAVFMADKTSETFWESGDQDAGRTKVIELINKRHFLASVACVYIDNQQDSAFRTKSITFYKNENKITRLIKTSNVEPNFTGWVKCTVHHWGNISLHIDSLDSQIRIRKIILLSHVYTANDRLLTSFDSLQADAFDLLQSIAQFAFKDSLIQDAKLQAQVMDLLISTPHSTVNKLREYIFMQMMQGLIQEIDLLNENTNRNFVFCQRLLLLFNKISETNNISMAAMPDNAELLISLGCLVQMPIPALHIATLTALQNMLGLCNPQNFDSKTFIENILISVVKAATFQLKTLPIDTTHKITFITFLKTNEDVVPSIDNSENNFYFAKSLQNLLQSLGRGDYGECWSRLVKHLLSDYLTNPSVFTYSYKNVQQLFEKFDFWRTAAALCIIEDESWLVDSSTWQHIVERLRRETSFCDNHEDGTTIADVYCKNCSMHLCKDCSFILHLRKVRRQHSLQHLNNSLAHLRLTVHKTCSRLKTSHFTLSIDHSSLHGLIDFRQDVRVDLRTSGGANDCRKCRFCGFNTNLPQDVCHEKNCQDNLAVACLKTLQCGHKCGGVLNESNCMPCLKYVHHL